MRVQRLTNQAAALRVVLGGVHRGDERARAKLVPLAAVYLDTALVPHAVAIGADRRDTAVIPMRAGRTHRSRAVDPHTAVVRARGPSWCRSPRSGWAPAGLTCEGP